MKPWILLLALFFSFPMHVTAQLNTEELKLAWQEVVSRQWIIAENKFPYQQCFEKAALEYDLPLTLLLAISRGESSFKPDAVSKANAIGLMQIQWPGTAKHLGLTQKQMLFDPCTNIDAGARYVKALLAQFDNNVHTALAAYNYGPSRIAKSKTIPSGAVWYSQYILDHHDTIVKLSSLPNENLSSVDAFDIITFGQPFRAKAMKESLSTQYTALQFDWFRSGDSEYVVRVLVNSAYQGVLAKRQLRYLGFF